MYVRSCSSAEDTAVNVWMILRRDGNAKYKRLIGLDRIRSRVLMGWDGECCCSRGLYAMGWQAYCHYGANGLRTKYIEVLRTSRAYFGLMNALYVSTSVAGTGRFSTTKTRSKKRCQTKPFSTNHTHSKCEVG